MKKTPSLLVVTDRGRFFAYQSRQDGSLVEIDRMEISEALEKISDQYSDSAGRFPSNQSNGEGGSFAERLPLQEELEMRSYRSIGQRIKELLTEHGFDTWGLVASPEIHNAILDEVDAPLRDKLVVSLKRNLTNESPDELRRRVLES